MDWLKCMNSVLDYIEDNLDGEIKEEKIATLSLSSKGIFQKIFNMITDMPLSEYVRKRKLTQAAIDIQKTDEKIIDIAVKYGYNSADAFTSAFKNFHGITPSDVKKYNIQPQSFQRLTFTLNLSIKGGNDDMQYRNINLESVEEFIEPTENLAVLNADNAGIAVRLLTEIKENADKSIDEQIDNLLMLLSELYAASAELASGIKQINTAIKA